MFLGRTTSQPQPIDPGVETFHGFRFAGGYLAFGLVRSSHYGVEASAVLEFDLSTRRGTVIWSEAGEPLQNPHLEEAGDPRSPQLALDGAGEVAWTVRESNASLAVFAHDAQRTHEIASDAWSGFPSEEPAIVGLTVAHGDVSWSYHGIATTAPA